MYDDLLLRLPDDEQDLWELVQAQFDHITADFERLHLETREDALANRFHTRDYGVRRDGLNVIRYRNVSEELDSRPYFWDMGRKLVKEVEQLLAAKHLTPVFVQQWGKLAFCHGYIMAHVFDDSDDLTPQRAGSVRIRDAQRKWIAHHIVPLLDVGVKRPDAEARLVHHIQAIREAGRFSEDFPKEWFDVMITSGDLAATYDQKHFSGKAMRALLLEPADDIPPVIPLFP